MASQEQQAPTHGKLGLFDAVSIIIGIVIGSSIYLTPIFINEHLNSPVEAMGVWTLGGVLALIGALCYAELATAYPKMGGDYAYLTKAYGPWFGFMFGWAQITVILTASIGMMGFIFGQYAAKLLNIPQEEVIYWQVPLALAAIGALAAINVLGVVFGKTTQNILSLAKVLGLGAIIYVGFTYGNAENAWAASPSPKGKDALYGVALILVLYAYGGWNDAAFVASDMRNRRHIPATLIIGTAGVMIIYLLVNFAYIQTLGFKNIQGFNPTPIAARVMEQTKGQLGEYADVATKGISVLVMISALGAINGLLFTGSRVCSALGKDHSLFAALGKFNPRFGSPVISLLILAGISMVMVLAVGTEAGRKSIDDVLAQIPVGPIPWDKYFGGFDTLFAGTAPVFWLFFLFAGLSVFVLREMDKETERPFKVPFYPYLPTIFCGMCVFGFQSAMSYAGLVSLIGWVPLALALPLYLFSRYTPVIIGEAPAVEKPAEEPAPAEPDRPPWMAPAEPPSDAPPADGDGIKPPEEKVPSPEG